MSALSANVQRRKAAGTRRIPVAVKTAAVIYDGALACIDSTGDGIAGANTAGNKCIGVAVKGYDNTDGADGVLGASPARFCEVEKGIFSFAFTGTPKQGALAWLVDDNTVGSVATNVSVGSFVEPDPEAPTTHWYVYVGDPSVVAAPGTDSAIVDLTDSTGGSGTHDDTLADGLTTVALTDNGGGTADGTVDSLAAAVTLTDSTGYDGTHDDTLAATTVPAALTEGGGAIGGTSDGDLTSLVDPAGDAGASVIAGVRENATMINTLIALVTVMCQNQSDTAQKVIELVTWQAVAQKAFKEVTTTLGTALTDLTVQNQNDSDLAQKVKEVLAALVSTGVISA